MKSTTPIHVLLVEDDQKDAKTIAGLLAESGLEHELTVVETANRAIAFLNHSHPFETATLPNLVLLGLELPKIAGVSVLAELQQQRVVRATTIGVIVFSKSEDMASRDAARVLGADAFVLKPVSPEDMESAASKLREVLGRLAGRAGRKAP